jgi:signal peptidase I
LPKLKTIAPESATTPAHEKETALESLAGICTVLVVGLFVIAFIFQNFEIPSASMEDTLLIGDHVFVDRETFAPASHWLPIEHARGPQRGDIIVFFKPGEPGLFLVKRVVAIPGDRLHLEHGVVILNGQPQPAPPEGHASNGSYDAYRDEFPAVSPDQSISVTATWAVEMQKYLKNGELVVPPGRYFAMGDNRPVSLDSRFWGFVPRENIVGRPLFIYWSFMTPEEQIEKTGPGDRIAWYSHIILHIFDQTRWRRTLRPVR